MNFLQFKIFEPYVDVLIHGLSTRHGGVSGQEPETEHLASLNLALALQEVAHEIGSVDDSLKNLKENYRRFCEAVGVDSERILTSVQVHGDKIFCLKADKADNSSLCNFGWGKPLSGFDGLITNVPDVALMVRFADCQGVLMLDPVKQVVATVHCGWRGNVQNIIGKAARKMCEEFDCDAENILVGISQSLGPCCAEFSNPEHELPKCMQKYVKNKYVDLWQCSFEQLIEAGVLAKNIEIMRRCTVCENDLFFSSRAGRGKMGLMGSIIGLKS